MGSTLCSAIDGNDVTALAIDNWSEFGGPSSEFYKSVGGADIRQARISVLNSDFRKVRWDSIGSYNIYLFDGPHSYQDQYDGIAEALPALDREFVFVVDDWNWPDVRSGTRRAIEDIGLNVQFEIEVRSTMNDIHPGEQGMPTNENSDWHNGYYFAVLNKRS